jgi:hypothetical protein
LKALAAALRKTTTRTVCKMIDGFSNSRMEAEMTIDMAPRRRFSGRKS